ncbi:MAG: tail fiber domain-containing protein [Deltaproteobacteria bacterium]|nr:tail fiber domain-containing protein [Deltaproteobacteria bacterium]
MNGEDGLDGAPGKDGVNGKDGGPGTSSWKDAPGQVTTDPTTTVVGIGTPSPAACLHTKGTLSKELGKVHVQEDCTIAGTVEDQFKGLAPGDAIKVGSNTFKVKEIKDGKKLTIDEEPCPDPSVDVPAYTDPDELLRVDNGAGVPKVTVTRGGNVGIGTTSPRSMLQVRQTNHQASTVLVGSDYPVETSYLRYARSPVSYVGNMFLGNSGDHSGSTVLGWSNDCQGDFLTMRAVDVRNGSVPNDSQFLADVRLSRDGGDVAKGYGKISCYTGDNSAGDSPDNLKLAMVIRSNGNVGIGTTSPAARLQVGDGHQAKDADLYIAREGATQARIYAYSDNASPFLSFVRNRGSVAAPTHVLAGDVLGVIYFGGMSVDNDPENTNTGTFIRSYAEENFTPSHGLSSLGFFTAFPVYGQYQERVTIRANGNVGIGTTNPSEKLQVEGAVKASLFIQSSSRDLKRDIHALPAPAALAALLALHPTRFRYKADPRDEQLGFIAEDVPELVATSDRMGVSPMDVAAVLTSVVQQQHETIVAQQRKIATLDERLRKIEAKLGL